LLSELKVEKEKQMSGEKYKNMERRMVDEVFNKGNIEVVDELFAPEYVLHMPGGQELRGPEGLKQYVMLLRTAFPDLCMTIQDLVAEGDKLAFRLTSQGTHKGDFMGIAPTGKKISITTINISRFAGGKVIEEWGCFDQMTMMQQLGVIPSPEQ
jgi:steroid delta-isomerase-like uncharacterized protein